MAEVFLVLVAAGVMLAVVVAGPRDVTLNWLRLGGIISLALLAAAGYFVWRARGDLWVLWQMALLVLAQLAFVQMGWRWPGSASAVLAFGLGVFTVVKTRAPPVATAAGVAAMTGLSLMAMLLGHAYLTASKMTTRPFRRLSWCLIGVFVMRACCAGAWVMWLQWRTPVAGLWPVHGFLVITRWTVGLLVSFVFVLMAHECIGRRSTQSATGILYVAGVLVFVGELLGLYLARETGLPF